MLFSTNHEHFSGVCQSNRVTQLISIKISEILIVVLIVVTGVNCINP